MRIRSALAAAVLGIALAAAGATSATADEDHRGYGEPRHHGVEHGDVCSPYIGWIDTSSSDLFWAGEHCDRF